MTRLVEAFVFLSMSSLTAEETFAKMVVEGSFLLPDLLQRCSSLFYKEPKWLRALCKRMIAKLGEGNRPSIPQVIVFLRSETQFKVRAARSGLSQRSDFSVPVRKMHPAAGAPEAWVGLPDLVKLQGLARWFNVSFRELEWFCDRGEFNNASPKLMHYHYRWIPKRNGKSRLIESPKQRLRRMQRSILDKILCIIPPHPCAHGFIRGKNTLSFTSAHCERRVVLKVDLKDFFPCITKARVAAIFRLAGYPHTVSDYLALLCTHATSGRLVPRSSSFTAQTSHKYLNRHLPQGAPTSPALANLCAFNLDCRLNALAKSSRVEYSRYADDLLFSGGEDFRRSITSFYHMVCSIALDEGFEVNTRKTRVMHSAQQQFATGIVLNQKQNVRRKDFDQLKAVLTNCARHGPASQNRENHSNFFAHLQGRIAYIKSLNSKRAEKLQKIFEQIPW